MPRRMHGEEGASLLIALGFLMLFALLVPAILRLGGTNFVGTERLQTHRTTHYAADAALDGAIQYLRQSDLVIKNPSCGGAVACPFTVTIDGTQFDVSVTRVNPGPSADQTVDLSVAKAGQQVAKARVFLQYSSQAAPIPAYVQSWQYLR